MGVVVTNSPNIVLVVQILGLTAEAGVDQPTTFWKYTSWCLNLTNNMMTITAKTLWRIIVMIDIHLIKVRRVYCGF